MKRYISILLLGFLFQSCTEEITLEPKSFTPKLVIEANIDWNKETTDDNKNQFVRLTKTTNFTSQDTIPVTGATVNVFDKDGKPMGTFSYDEKGNYVATDFKTPVVGETYRLEVVSEGQTYTGEDIYTSIVDINPDDFTQEEINFGEEAIRFDIVFENEIGVDNYYLLELIEPEDVSVLPYLESFDDEFFSEEPGKNFINTAQFSEDYEAGDVIGITLYGISRRYQEFMNKIILLTDGDGGPFSTAPATIRGNIENTTNKDNFPLGFFSMNQFVETTYTIKSEEELAQENE